MSDLFLRVICFATELAHADWSVLSDDELRQVVKSINRAQSLCVDEIVRRCEVERRRTS